MKTIISLAVSTALFSLATSAQAVSLYDFDEASSAYEDAYINGSLNLNSGNQAQTSHDLDVDLEYERVISSQRRDIELNAKASGSSKRGGNSGDNTVRNYQAEGNGSINTYFTQNPKGAFWYGDATVGAKKSAEKEYLKVGAGLGYGRVVNVTPMARAIRIVEELRTRGKITGAVPTAVYKQVARVIDKEASYRAKYGTRDYAKYWVADMEKALKSAGVVRDLGALGILSLNDVLTKERISTRKHGWRVQAGVSQVVQDYDGTKSQQALDVSGEYHRPISNQTQFSNVASLSKIVDEDGYTVRNSMDLTHEISDRVDWENNWTISRTEDNAGKASTQNDVSSSYIYSLSNRLDYTVTAKASKATGEDDVNKSLNMGVRYRLK